VNDQGRPALTIRPTVSQVRVVNSLPNVFSMMVMNDGSATPGTREKNTTSPLEMTVFTSVKPAFSRARLSSGILQLVGMTPRRSAE
jgi:hypothetical protein